MKYGMIVLNKTTNIGDDIQSYAEKKYLPQIDYYIEREKLNDFVPKTNEIVAVIMNGWFAQGTYGMPPSPFIEPLILSAHFIDGFKDKYPEYLTGYFIEYLKKYQPVGCRDEFVKKHFEENQVENYFSGCLTLTIEKFPEVNKENYICAVDLEEEELKALTKMTKKEIRVISHSIDPEEHQKLSYEERMGKIEELLKTYQGASCVITTRLDCALPCLALETPTLFVYDNQQNELKNKLGKYSELLHHTSRDRFINLLEKDFIKNPPKNNTNYLKYREILEEKCLDFIRNISKKDSILKEESTELYQRYFVVQKEYLETVANKRLEMEMARQEKELHSFYQKQLAEFERTKSRYQLQIEALEKEKEYMMRNLSIKNDEIESIVNSKGYRTLESFRKIKGRLRKRKSSGGKK